MLREDMLLQIFNEGTSGKNHANGQRVLNNELVSSLDITSEDNLICIDSNVISEKLFNEYSAKIEMDAEKKSIITTFCSCIDYEQNGPKKNNYCCKHLVATFYKALEELASNPLLNETVYEENSIFNNKGNVLAMLLGNESHKEEVKIEIYINKNKWSNNLSAEFKIGDSLMSSSNLYILKDIDQFLAAYYNNFPVSYSKNFTFNNKDQKLSIKDKRLIDFIQMLKDMEGKHKHLKATNEWAVQGKYIKYS